MENKKQPDDLKYIKELMQPTPSGIAKLLAAWSGLSTETQILILSKLDEMRAPAYLAEKVRKTAIDSENAYVRYLAARKIYFSNDCSDEEKLLKEKIENDPVALVKYSLLEDSSGISAIFDDSFKDADTFVTLPHEARLAKIRLVDGNGERIAALLSQIADKHLKDGTVSEIELYEILADYLAKPEFHERYTDTRVTYDGWGEYTKGKDIESLWKLVPKLPEGISHILIENLPEASGLKNEIPEDVINSMTDHQLETLLYRKDIGLGELRKTLFWEAGEDRDRIKSAAISSNFQIEYEEFAKILAKPPKERVSILKDIGMMASQLSLCFYDAIHDALFASDVSPLGNDFEDAIFARDALERRIRELAGWRREKELTELRLYRLANSAVPWDTKKEGYAPSGELEFLSEKIVPDDTWATFMAFSEAWSRRSYQVKELDKYLPRIYEIDEDDLEPQELDSAPRAETNSELIKGIDEKLKELQQIIKLSDNQGNEELMEGFDKIRYHANQLNTYTQNHAEGLHAEFKKLQSSLNRQRLLLYAAIGLIIWLLIVQH
jgi:hypothetical protein